MSGVLDISDLYIRKYKSYNKKTSYETIRQICKEMGLGFNSNITTTNDSMTWIQRAKTKDFLVDIIKRSYISDDTFLIGYIDYYYCFNYIDVEKELKRNIDNDINIGANNSESLITKDNRTESKLLLSNDKGLNNSNLFISKYVVHNESMSRSLKNGYLVNTTYYDKLGKNALLFDVDSITDKDDKVVILKGKTNDEELYRKNSTKVYMGKIDIDNVHKNYAYSFIQNKINLDNLAKIRMDITIPNLNWSIYRYQKVNIAIRPLSETPIKDDTVWKLSGEWLISSIDMIWGNGGMSQKANVVRRNLGKNITMDVPINNI